jgi:hypothetical protein
VHGVPRFGHQRQPRLHGSQLLLNSRELCDTTGTNTLWIGGWGARGGIEGEYELSDLEISDRPGQTEEYERVMAARKRRGLPLPPNVEVEVEDA